MDIGVYPAPSAFSQSSTPTPSSRSSLKGSRFLWHIPSSDAEHAFKQEDRSDAVLDSMQEVELPWAPGAHLLGRQARLQSTLPLTKYSVHIRRLQTTAHLSSSSYIKRLTARNSLSTTRSETRFAMS